MIKKKILITAGGTGGHIFPAYSLAKFLINKNYNVKVTTDKRGLKYLKNYKELNLTVIPSSPLFKENILKLFISTLIVFYAIVKSTLFLIFNRPTLIFGMGGYSSFPICIAATILKIKFIIYESNLIVGKANKYLLPFAEKIFVSHKELTGISNKYDNKVFEIGNIVREEIINANFSSRKVNMINGIKILVLGGSQAAKVFAEKLPKIFVKFKNSNIPIKVFQQCQKNQNEQLSQFYQKAKIDHKIFNFTEKIVDYYSKVNLVITRSGASVLGELVNVNVPFISIPLPTSADNHQYKNAEFYQKKGYGYLLEEKDINCKLYDLINNIFKDQSLVEKILSRQRQYSDKEIFKNLINQIEKIVNDKN